MWFKQQLNRAFISVAYPVAGITVANLADVKIWMEITSLSIGILGGIIGICSMIHHWNDHKKND